MKTTLRTFLQTSALASIAAIAPPNSDAASPKPSMALDTKELDGYEIAGRHPLVRTKPGPTYFEGMLLGNGDIGVCAVVRPDALGLHISKSDCWDIRVTEGTEKDVRPFAEILEMWKRASEELKQKGYKPGDSVESADFFRDYLDKVGHSYSKPWPRPWPCGPSGGSVLPSSPRVALTVKNSTSASTTSGRILSATLDKQETSVGLSPESSTGRLRA
jgi:hypothetical protein